MKKLILILSLVLMSQYAFSQETPAYLKDGTITVTLKNGKSYTFSSNEYAIVLRKPKSSMIIPVIGSVEEKPIVKQAPELPYYKNRVSLLVGYGLTGQQSVSSGPNHVDIEQKKGAVGGISLQRDLNKEYHIIGVGTTNQTFMLGVGKGF